MPWLNEDTVYPASTGQAGGNARFLQLPFPSPTTNEQITANFQEITRWANNQPKPHRLVITSLPSTIDIPGDGTRTYIGTAQIDSGQTYKVDISTTAEPIVSLAIYSDPLPYGGGVPGIRKWVGQSGIMPVKFFAEVVTVSGDPYGNIRVINFTPVDIDADKLALTPFDNVLTI